MRLKLAKRKDVQRKKLYFAVALLILSVFLAILSIFPVYAGSRDNTVLIDDNFTLTQQEVYRQGLGSFHGGENVSIIVSSSLNSPKNFSVITYNAVNFTEVFATHTSLSFIAGADYYEAVFYSSSLDANLIHLQVFAQLNQVTFPFSQFETSAKLLFFISLATIAVDTIAITFSAAVFDSREKNLKLPSIGKTGRKRLAVFLLVSLVFWLFLIALNTNSLASFEGWYTDHARHPYSSTLFLKTGFSVFSEPLGQLSSGDTSNYKFVTWPEMPHLYPLGSIFLFLPFGLLLQSGFGQVLVFKLEIALFIVFAHVCLYFFLKYFWKKEFEVPWKLVGVYIIYIASVIYAVDGMFDAIPFLISIFALSMFLVKRYDYFILLIGASVLLKYQGGIFLLPLVIFSLIEVFRSEGFNGFIKNKAMLAGVALASISLFTAALSAPFLLATRPQLIMNGINAFNAHSQISWWLQSLAVLLTLAVTLVYAFYMLNKNSLMTLASIFLLLPSYMLPYIQNWYLPFIFIYILIPNTKKELVATMLWLIFMIGMLSFGGASFNPLQVINSLRIMLKL